MAVAPTYMLFSLSPRGRGPGVRGNQQRAARTQAVPDASAGIECRMQNKEFRRTKAHVRHGVPDLPGTPQAKAETDVYATRAIKALACPIRVTLMFIIRLLETERGSECTTFSGQSGSGAS